MGLRRAAGSDGGRPPVCSYRVPCTAGKPNQWLSLSAGLA